MQTIYVPKGKANEYCKLALNLFGSCPHGCLYCYARPMAARFGRPWNGAVEPRAGLLDALKAQLEKGHVSHKEPTKGNLKDFSPLERIPLKGALIHLCFTVDAYPLGFDTSITREAIKLIKDAGSHVQILTKGGLQAERDFDLLDENDWFGVTYAGYFGGLKDVSAMYKPIPCEPNAANANERLASLKEAHRRGIKTWVSCEPVLCPDDIYALIQANYIDTFKIGKLNYAQPAKYGFPNIDWGAFGRECERLCIEHGRGYYIKEDLRAAMDATIK